MYSLRKVSFNNSVEIIPESAFYDCSSLTNITIPNTVKAIGNSAFLGCAFTSITIPNSVESLGVNSFYCCYNLNEITIGKSVSFIGDGSFIGCRNIQNIYSKISYPNNVTLGGNLIFDDIPKDNCTLHVPKGTVPIYRGCIQWKDFKNIVDDISETTTGDLDGSAMVDVDDVNAMINLILNFDQYKDKYPGSADLDGNGMVDVDDVNALINIILAK